MAIKLTGTSFSFPKLSFERSLLVIAALEIARFDIGAHLGGDAGIEDARRRWRACSRPDVVSESLILRDLIRPVPAG